MPTPRDVLTPESLSMIQAIADAGSFAAAARGLDVVPSALTYRVRQVEDALDVLLFDRSSRQARLTPAGAELLRESDRLLADIDAIANRVKRIATGWEPQLTIAVDSIIDMATVMELCDDFFALKSPTRLRLCSETLSGTLEALTSGFADLAIGVVLPTTTASNLHREPIGQIRYVFAVAPHHPLAKAQEPLRDDVIRGSRAVAVADSTRQGRAITIGLLAGQDVFTVFDMHAKLDAQLRGLGSGFLPTCVAQPYIDTGRLVVKRVERREPEVYARYAWRSASPGRTSPGRTSPGRTSPRMTSLGAKSPGEMSPEMPALAWWLKKLKSPTTRAALLGNRRRTK